MRRGRPAGKRNRRQAGIPFPGFAVFGADPAEARLAIHAGDFLDLLAHLVRFSWIEAITGPTARPRSTSTTSESWSELSSASGTASLAPAR